MADTKEFDAASECVEISNRYGIGGQEGQDMCDEIWSLVQRAEQAAAERARQEDMAECDHFITTPIPNDHRKPSDFVDGQSTAAQQIKAAIRARSGG